MLRPIRIAMGLLALSLPVAVAASPFAGTYSGQSTMGRGAPPTCAEAGKRTWTITDGKVNMKYGNAPLSADVKPDGTFSVTQQYKAARAAGTAQMVGKISGGSLEADIEGDHCKYHYSLKKG